MIYHRKAEQVIFFHSFFPFFCTPGFLKFFNWKIIALQCCVSFCPITARISHDYIHPFPLDPVCLPPTPPLWVISERQAGLPVLCSGFPRALCFTRGTICMSVLLSHFVLPSPFPTVSPSPFSLTRSPFLL